MPGAPLRVTLAKGGSIEGVVRDAASGQPVAGARIEAREEGRLRLSAVGAGRRRRRRSDRCAGALSSSKGWRGAGIRSRPPAGPPAAPRSPASRSASASSCCSSMARRSAAACSRPTASPRRGRGPHRARDRLRADAAGRRRRRRAIRYRRPVPRRVPADRASQGLGGRDHGRRARGSRGRRRGRRRPRARRRASPAAWWTRTSSRCRER